MAVLGILSQRINYKVQNAYLLNTWPLAYPTDAPIQPYFIIIDVGMSNPVPLQPYCTAWACDNCAPLLLLS